MNQNPWGIGGHDLAWLCVGNGGARAAEIAARGEP